VRCIFLFLLLLCACSKVKEQADTSPPKNQVEISEADSVGQIIISFDYEKQSGYASNQFAVWVEDTTGNFIKTLYATKFTANGGYKNRPDSIPLWVEKSDVASMQKSEVDAITGATPKTGKLSYTWDLTDENGNEVSPGQYIFFVEGSLRWQNRVLYSGTVEVGKDSVTIEADAEFFYESSGNQSSLSDNSPENNMISSVVLNFIPASDK